MPIKSGIIHFMPALDATLTAPTGMIVPAGTEPPSEQSGDEQTSRTTPSVIQVLTELLHTCTLSPLLKADLMGFRICVLIISGMIHFSPALELTLIAPAGIMTPAGGEGPSDKRGTMTTSVIMPSVIQLF
mmetsp:Transcript_573/g.919  ORF Transcript_573/g.919 Transcript_573/m.919 type:complete len:130 (-) Transcript_573:228-617(-)